MMLVKLWLLFFVLLTVTHSSSKAVIIKHLQTFVPHKV